MSEQSNEKHKKEIAVTVSTESFLRLAGLTLTIVILFIAVRKAEHAIILILTGAFLALALNAPVYWLSRRLPGKSRGSRALATTISFLIVIILIGAFFASIVPPLVRQTESLVNAAPHLIRDIHNQNNGVGHVIRHYRLEK